MSTVTLQNLIDRARSIADMPLAGFVTDAELKVWVNDGIGVLHEKLVSAYGEEYASSESVLTTIAGQTDYALPATFFKLYGVDLTFGSSTRALRPYMRSERNAYRNQTWAPSMPLPRYSLVGNNLRLLPAPPAATGKILFAPAPTSLSLTTDTVTFPSNWERYVALYAAIQMRRKEETDIRDHVRELEKWDRELMELAADRDLAFPKQAVDLDVTESENILWGL